MTKNVTFFIVKKDANKLTRLSMVHYMGTL